MSKIVLVVNNNEPRVDSRVIADGLGIQHKNVVETIRRYQSDFEDFNHLTFETEVGVRQQGGGKAEIFVHLDEDQAIFLLTLSRNSERVVALKKGLTKTFGKYRKHAVKQASIEWQQQRSQGKITRRAETDTIKAFVEYATAQGSKSASKYYMALSKMENAQLFDVPPGTKPDNLRDALDVGQLFAIGTADQVVAKSLMEGMAGKLEYKEIYKLARERCRTLGLIVGRSPVPQLIAGPATTALLEAS